jgi:hypothetical protein
LHFLLRPVINFLFLPSRLARRAPTCCAGDAAGRPADPRGCSAAGLELPPPSLVPSSRSRRSSSRVAPPPPVSLPRRAAADRLPGLRHRRSPALRACAASNRRPLELEPPPVAGLPNSSRSPASRARAGRRPPELEPVAGLPSSSRCRASRACSAASLQGRTAAAAEKKAAPPPPASRPLAPSLPLLSLCSYQMLVSCLAGIDATMG